MRPVRPVTVGIVAGLVLLAGLAGGYLVHDVIHGAATPSSGGSSPATLSVVAAGTLDTLFPEVANALANATPGLTAPMAAQQYEGSLAALSTISTLNEAFDVAAAADYRLIPSLLAPGFASWEVVFATTPEVLAYDPSVAAFSGINASNWAERLTEPGVLLGVANQSTDPNGYNGIFVLELEGSLSGGGLGGLYGHFYTTAVGTLAEPNPSTTRVEPETQVATLLSTHAVSAFITYRSYAVSHGLSYVTLDPRVSLGATDEASVSFYSTATTTVLGAAGPTVVRGAPVLFGATVPLNAPRSDLGVAFVHYLISPAGALLMGADGFAPLAWSWTYGGTALPSLLVPDVTPLPASLPGVSA